MTLDQFTCSLWSELHDQLDSIPTNEGNKLSNLEARYRLTEGILKRLKEFVIDYTFKTEEEEIAFFKYSKPKFESMLILFSELLTIELNRPISGRKVQKQYLIREQEIIQSFMQSQQPLYIYLELKRCDSDPLYFLRKNISNTARPNGLGSSLDERFSTVFSLLVAKINACKEINIYLQNEIKRLSDEKGVEYVEDYNLVWTAPKAHLIELIYALKVSGVFNNGAVEIKQIAKALGIFLPNKLTDYYRTFQEIRIRKKSRTAFLDLLKDRLIQSMENTEALY